MRLFIALAFAAVTSFAHASDFSTEALALQPFELRWMNHEDTTTIYRSADHADAVFVLEAYFRNCPYCNDNAPFVDRLQEHYANNPRVQILDVSRDCRQAEYTSWINAHHPNHPVLNDCNMQVLGPLGVRGYPSTYIADCNLRVVKTTTGAWGASTYTSLVNAIDAALANECVRPE